MSGAITDSDPAGKPPAFRPRSIAARAAAGLLRLTVTPGEPTGGGKSTVIPREKQEDPFRSALFEAQKRIAQVEAETRAIGLNSEARERAK